MKDLYLGVLLMLLKQVPNNEFTLFYTRLFIYLILCISRIFVIDTMRRIQQRESKKEKVS